MNVKQLRKALKEFPPDMEIIMGSDEEGNDYITPYFPTLSWCARDNGYRCGWHPLHDDDVVEYDKEDLVQKVVM